MYRKIFKYLKEWKESPYRKPLILQGARQVGKNFSIHRSEEHTSELQSQR